MLMPTVNSYFAIYTLGDVLPGEHKRSSAWDLHATATDRNLAISHARMLALQPGVGEVHVKQVIENLASGLVSVREIKRCKRGRQGIIALWLCVAALCAALPALCALVF